MKKMFVLGLFTSMLLASCVKDYTCECTSSVQGPTGTTSSTSSSTINAKKKDAITSCDEGDATATAGGYTSTVSCSIK